MLDTPKIYTRTAKVYYDAISKYWILNAFIDDRNTARKRHDTFEDAKAAAIAHISSGEYPEPVTFRMVCDLIA